MKRLTQVVTPAPSLAAQDLSFKDLKSAQIQAISVDTSIIANHPGVDVIRAGRGLSQFMHWDQLIIAKPGDFKHLTPVKKRHLTKDGLRYLDPKNGMVRCLKPAEVVDTQIQLHPHIMLMLSQTPSYYAPYDEVKKAVDINTAWAQLAKQAYVDNQTVVKPALFATVQGAGFKDLRQASVNSLIKIGFDGYVIGGLSDIDNDEEYDRILKVTNAMIPDYATRMIVGVSSLAQVKSAVEQGIDLIETNLPSQWGRYGKAITTTEVLHLKKAKFATDFNPIDEDCACEVCLKYTRAFIRHLLQMNEPLGNQLISQHNLAWLQSYMKRMYYQSRS